MRTVVLILQVRGSNDLTDSNVDGKNYEKNVVKEGNKEPTQEGYAR